MDFKTSNEEVGQIQANIAKTASFLPIVSPFRCMSAHLCSGL